MRLILQTLSFSLLLIAHSSHAVDINNGIQLHKENCVRCHQASLYTRENRIATDFDKLHQRVRDCELMLELTWFDEEVDDVTAYLNQEYYKYNLEK